MSEHRLGLVSDALGRERAITIVRGILDDEDDAAERSDNDDIAVRIVLRLDHALEAKDE